MQQGEHSQQRTPQACLTRGDPQSAVRASNGVRAIPNSASAISNGAHARNGEHALDLQGDEPDQAQVARTRTSSERIQELERMVTKLTAEKEQLHKGNTSWVFLQEKKLENKYQNLNKKLADLAEENEELKAQLAKHRRKPSSASKDRDIFDMIKELGSTMDMAKKAMANLVKRNGKAQQSFDNWDAKFCLQAIELVQLTERVQAERKLGQRELGSRTDAVVQREKEVSQRGDELEKTYRHRNAEIEKKQLEYTEKHEKLMDELRTDRETLRREKHEWQHQQAGKLKGELLKEVQNIWIRKQEEEIMPQMIAAAEQGVKEANDASCASAKEDGWRAGRAAGLEQGRREGLQQGRTEGQIASRFEGIHKAMVLLAEYGERSSNGWDNSQSPSLIRNPYWLGREVACWVKDQNL
jgi:chromosome segregation ATPase